MNKIVIASAIVLMSSSAFAQQATPATPETPAVASPTETNPSAPVPGENSFTEAQAKERIEEKGYTNVTGLALDDKGVWVGSADKSGASVEVKLDYQGNITEAAK